MTFLVNPTEKKTASILMTSAVECKTLHLGLKMLQNYEDKTQELWLWNKQIDPVMCFHISEKLTLHQPEK